MVSARSRTYYELFGVAPDCSFEELRRAYRRLARERHPDVASPRPGLGTMAEINEAWRVLSDTERRRNYDEVVLIDLTRDEPVVSVRPMPARGSSTRDSEGLMSLRQAWVAGVQAQIARLARLAGRSATQTLLIRNPRGQRCDYELVVDAVVAKLACEVEPRVRAARAAGAAPLDLGVSATLMGIRSVADSIRRQATLELTTELLMEAELLDRMWDILAHELPSSLTVSLGGNPQVARAITPRR